MKNISTLQELERFIGCVIRDDKKFLSLITEIKVDEFDFFKFYEKIISFASDHYNVKITLNVVPFNLKFALVNFTINSSSREEIAKKIFDNIFKTDAAAGLLKVKKDSKACLDMANISCISGNYDLSYLILNHITKNFDELQIAEYPEYIQLLSYLIGHLSVTIQKNLFGDKEDCINPKIQNFVLSFMQITHTKKEETSIYKLLLAEYPKILRLYQEAFSILERFKQIDGIIIIL